MLSCNGTTSLEVAGISQGRTPALQADLLAVEFGIQKEAAQLEK
jgi:hypothetical protein